MFLPEQIAHKKKTKSARKFHRDKIIPRLRSVSILNKQHLKEQNQENRFISEVQNKEMQDILKEYQTNPYFRIKMKVAMNGLKENMGITEPKIKKKASKMGEGDYILQTLRTKGKDESVRLEKLLKLKEEIDKKALEKEK